MENNELQDPLYSSEDNDVLIIKGKFKFQLSNIYGIFVLLIDQVNCDILEDFIFASYFSDLHFLDIKENWTILEDELNRLKISGEYAESITHSFKKSFDEFLGQDINIISSIIVDYKAKDFKKVYRSFEALFGRIQKDRHVNIEIHYEEIHSDHIKSVRDTRISQEKPKANENILKTPAINIDPFAFSIPANPILAPVSINSIKSQDLKPGKNILMRINTSSEYGQQWVETFNALNTQKGEIIPIVATVEQIGPIIKKSLDILVTYNPNQYTKFNIETDVKIKLYDPNSPEQVIIPDQNEDNTDLEMDASLSFASLYKDSNFKTLVAITIILFILAITALFFI